MLTSIKKTATVHFIMICFKFGRSRLLAIEARMAYIVIELFRPSTIRICLDLLAMQNWHSSGGYGGQNEKKFQFRTFSVDSPWIDSVQIFCILTLTLTISDRENLIKVQERKEALSSNNIDKGSQGIQKETFQLSLRGLCMCLFSPF